MLSFPAPRTYRCDVSPKNLTHMLNEEIRLIQIKLLELCKTAVKSNQEDSENLLVLLGSVLCLLSGKLVLFELAAVGSHMWRERVQR